LLRGVVVDETHRKAAVALCTGSQRAVWLGAIALRHPAYVDLRALAAELARISGAKLGVLAEGANAAGAWLAGAVPHRAAGGAALSGSDCGLDAQEMLATPQRAYLLVGAIEPAADLADASLARAAFAQAACVVALTPYASEEVKEFAHVLLPMAAYAETSGHYVNLEGRLQGQAAVATSPGDTRPGWKVLRVLGNLLELPNFEYQSSEEVLGDWLNHCGGWSLGSSLLVQTPHVPAIAAVAGSAQLDLGKLDVPMYAIDAVLRRSPALQQTAAAKAAAMISAEEAQRA
jgi:NADH-quinone oxidoreductase subunit G